MMTPTAWVRAKSAALAFGEKLDLGELIEERWISDTTRVYAWESGAITVRLHAHFIKRLEAPQLDQQEITSESAGN